MGSLARNLATAQTNLDREAQASARREENKRKAEYRATEQADARQRQSKKAHAREVARLSSPTVRYVHQLRTVPTPKPEQLRVLYLTANPEQNLRTDAEVRGVQDQVRRALHRDLITINHRPAANSDDLIAGLNDLGRWRYDCDVVDGDATLGQQLFHVSVREPVAQVSAHRQHDDLTGKRIQQSWSRAEVPDDNDDASAQPVWGSHPPTQQPREKRAQSLP